MFIPLLIERGTEKYIVLDGKMLEPGRLSSIRETMHQAVLVDFVGIFGEYEFSPELGHLSEECHLNWKVNESQSRKVPLTCKEGGFSASRGPCGTKG